MFLPTMPPSLSPSAFTKMIYLLEMFTRHTSLGELTYFLGSHDPSNCLLTQQIGFVRRWKNSKAVRLTRVSCIVRMLPLSPFLTWLNVLCWHCCCLPSGKQAWHSGSHWMRISAIQCNEEMDFQEGRGEFQRSKRQLNPDTMCEKKRVKTGTP